MRFTVKSFVRILALLFYIKVINACLHCDKKGFYTPIDDFIGELMEDGNMLSLADRLNVIFRDILRQCPVEFKTSVIVKDTLSDIIFEFQRRWDIFKNSSITEDEFKKLLNFSMELEFRGIFGKLHRKINFFSLKFW